MQDKRFHLPGKKVLRQSGTIFEVALVNATECPCKCPKKTATLLFGQEETPPQKAQVVTDHATGQILATACCEGKQADFALFKASRTVFCLADSSYQGLDKLRKNARTPRKKSKHYPLTDDEKASNRALSRKRIRCEYALVRLKVFKILAHPYRNRRLELRFNLLAAICNLERAK